MNDGGNRSDKNTWAVGGGVLVGIGVGLFLLHQSVLYFIGSLIAGLGIGLFTTAVLSTKKQ